MKKGPSPRISPIVLLLVFASICGLTAGPLYNSNAVRNVWASVGLLGWLGGDAALLMYQQGLTYFQSVDCCASPLVGLLLDNLGPRFTATTGILIYATALYLIQIESVICFLLSAALQGLMIQMVLSATISIGNLVRWSSAAVALLSGSADVAMSVFLVFDYIGKEGYAVGMKVYMAIVLLCSAVSYVLLPSVPFEPRPLVSLEEPRDIEVDAEGEAAIEPTHAEEEGKALKESLSNGLTPKDDDVRFLTQFLTPQYFCFLTIFSMGVLRQNFYLNNSRLLLAGLGDDGTYADILSHFLPCCIFFSILAGFIADLTSPSITVLVHSLATCACELLTLIAPLRMQFLTFFLFTFQKSSLFTLMYVFIGKSFGFRNFGMLCGICSVSGGVVNLSQVFLSTYIDNDADRARHVVFGLLCVGGLLLILIAYLLKHQLFYQRGKESHHRVMSHPSSRGSQYAIRILPSPSTKL